MIHDFLFTFPIPFLLVFTILGLNEYRLYKIKKIDFASFKNSMVMLLVSLLSFMGCQVILNIK
jgi:hypothetical protein